MTTGDSPRNDQGGSDSPAWSQAGQQPYPGQPYGPQDPYSQQSYHGQQAYPGQPGTQFGTPNAATSGRSSATDFVSSAWHLFSHNPLPWILVTLVIGIANVLSMVAPEATSSVTGSIGSLFFTVLIVVITAFMIRGALLEVDGHKPSIGAFFTFHNFGWYILANIIIGLIVGIPMGLGLGMFFTAIIIGGSTSFIVISLIVMILTLTLGIVVTFFLYWTLNFVIDRNMNAIDAIRSSYNAIKSDLGNLLLLTLLNTVILAVGMALCGLGMLIAYPVTILASTIAYRKVTGPSDFSRAAVTG